MAEYRPVPKPQCGRCYRHVDSATSTPIVVNGVNGQQLEYACHGERKTYDVTNIWMNENPQTPFLLTIFDPLPPPEAIKVDEAKRRFELQRQFILDTIQSIAETQVSFTGDLPAWCETNAVVIQVSFSSLNDLSSDSRTLVIAGNVMGHFIFWISTDEMRWMPSKGTKAKQKAK